MLPEFPFNLYAGSFLLGALLTGVSLPFWRGWCLRMGLVDDPGHRKIHQSTTPLAGGLAVLTGFLFPLLGGLLLLALRLGPDLDPALLHGLSRRALQLCGILVGASAMVLLGALDDRYELAPKWKFAGQLLIALLTAGTGIRITLFIPSEIFSYLITVLWILTLINALNFLDNMNGLCGGLGFIAAWGCAWAAALKGQYLVAILAFQICGALLGFLPYNFPKASVFLGDSGSHLVGYLVAVLSILPNYYTPELPHKVAVLAPLVILALPLFDLVSVVLIRWKLGRPFWIGDTNHISHRLVRNGWSKPAAVLLIWLGASFCSFLALVLLSP